MEKREFVKLLAAIELAYSQFNITSNIPKVDLWYKMLGHYEYPLMAAAVHRHILTNQWPPTISDLTEAAQPAKKEIGDTWGKVKKAMAAFGTYREQEALASVDQLTAEAIKIMGWRSLCLSTNEMADRAHFLKIYGSLEKRSREENILPSNIKNLIGGFSSEKEKICSGNNANIGGNALEYSGHGNSPEKA